MCASRSLFRSLKLHLYYVSHLFLLVLDAVMSAMTRWMILTRRSSGWCRSSVWLQLIHMFLQNWESCTTMRERSPRLYTITVRYDKKNIVFFFFTNLLLIASLWRGNSLTGFECNSLFVTQSIHLQLFVHMYTQKSKLKKYNKI